MNLKGVLWVIANNNEGKIEYFARHTTKAKLSYYKSKHALYKYLRNNFNLTHTQAINVVELANNNLEEVLPVDLSTVKLIKREKAFLVEQQYYKDRKILQKTKGKNIKIS